jgi:hypothetical protein
MPLTVPQTVDNLIAYFRNGDKPDEDQFEEFIRTMFFLYNDMVNKAAAAQAAAEAAADLLADGRTPTAMMTVTGSNLAAPAFVGSHFGVASVAWDAPHLKMVITFDAAFANTNYKILRDGTIGGGTLTKFTDRIEITFLALNAVAITLGLWP